QLSDRRDAFTKTAAELTAEIARLEAGGHDAPPAPHTRDPQVRDTRPGAPLWKVTDFAPGVPEEHRAGLEAALESAGILDAWLTPDGELIAGDVVLVSGRHPVTGPSCDTVLVPAVNTGDPRAAAVPEAAVRAALSAIGLGEGTGTAWVTIDGRWANGVLTGSWHKDAAGHIGEGARETARRERITQRTAELAEVNDALTALDEALGELDGRKGQLAAEHRAVPPDAAVREAHTRAAEQRKRRQELREARAVAEQVRAERQAALDATLIVAEEFAADTRLPANPEELAAVRVGLGDYRVALAALWPAAEAFETAGRRAAEASEELADATERLTEATERAAAVREAATAAQALYEALLETAGAAVEELNRKLDELRRDTGRRNADEKAARELEQQAISDRGKAEGTRDTLRTEIEEATRVRDAAVAEFQSFAATGVLRIALPDLDVPDPAEPWPPTPAVILARAVNAALEDTDDADGPWDRVQRRVTDEHKLLADAMARHGHSAGLTVRDGIMVVDVVFQGRSHDVPGLAAALGAEAGQRARLLSAREREILENHLLNEVAGTLHELITAAEAEVRTMNDELESRPTSTGMKLRLVWQQARDAPDGLDQVRHKLRQTIDAWSADDRAAVGSFLQARIATEHAGNPAAGWAEALTAALDYRRWHEFVIQRYQDGQWRSATGPASGGERALVASVPLFAAASAYYKSAGNPHAPRLIALDEAFAGVDDDSRAKCLGLLATFDMDVVMTSEREWGCYPQVPGLAICQLARQDGIDAVLVTPWRWDGRERRRAERAAV
ncbi:MAG TPA: TIGR02680 family protein, partial [Streptosporangiaceae bacterium]|nr:TIGR02680 family protein [Streptosporangiaceae bacterium]